MSILAIIVGVAIVLSVIADLVNTLVTTTTSQWRWWMTRILYQRTWAITRAVGHRITDERRRERFFSIYAPLTVLGMLVVLRTFVSWTLTLEVEGRWPWQPEVAD